MTASPLPPEPSRQPSPPVASPQMLYDRKFYSIVGPGSERSARRVMGHLLEHLHPRSVVDVGCGIGTWLRVCLDLGVAEVLGIDGAHIDRSQLRIPVDCFQAADLAGKFCINGRFDLALSLEVAEHLPASQAEYFVAALAAAADVILFGAAIPGQGGLVHLNEQWPEYWASLFRAHGFQVFDCIRWRFWDDEAVECWYAQNTLLYVHPRFISRNAHVFTAMQPSHDKARALVHPGIYQYSINNARVRLLLSALPRAIGRLLRSRWARVRGTQGASDELRPE